MAASSSDSPSSKSRENYGVFLSFRGPDVRNTFISRLYEKLCDKGVHTFKDSPELELGDRRGELFDAIEGSRIAVVTFSENYARSKWCLNELVKILDREKQGKIVVVPIFYKVTPGEVRLHEKEKGVKGCYQLAMEEMEAQYGTEMANIWREVLKDGGDLIGESVDKGKDEGEVVKLVVEKVLKISNRVPMEVAKYPTGIDSRLEDIKLLLRMAPHVDDVFMIGIHGLGGAGKTTLAKAICNDIADKFDDWCFLQDVRTTDLVLSQQTLLRQLLGKPDLIVPSVDQGKHLIKERLCHRRVLVILDNVDNSDQLDALAGNHDWFGKRSRVIITTRDRHVLDSAPVQHVHEITLLDKGEAMSLFRSHAFCDGQKNIKIDNLLIDRCLDYAAMLPLALVVLGSFLCGRKEPAWKSTLEKLGKNPDKTINSVLKISFEGLDDQQKEIFLDIACFFKGWDRDYVMKILDSCGFETLIEMEVLVERCLVTVEDGKFRMHDLLERMGKSIVRDEKAIGGLPSRIWSYEDFLDVLSDDVVPENYAVKGVVLDLATKKKKLINANSFKFSRRLRLLIVRNGFNPKEPLNLPRELRWLEWPKYSASTLWLGAFSKLVGLDMWRSNIKEINGEESNRQTEEEEQELAELKYVNLSNCQSLITLPNLSKSSKLQDLNLQDCKNLTGLDESIRSLDELVHLNFGGCHNLSTFPSLLKSRHFRTLNFSDCFKLSKFPAIKEELHFLTELKLDGTAVKELPDSIVNLVAVKFLSLDSCKELSIIPARIGRLKNLEELDLKNCENLEEVQGLPPHPRRLYMEGCRRLRTFPRLHTFMSQSPTMNFVNLSGCQNLGSAYMNESLPYQMVRKFQGVATVILPAEEIPHWMNFQTMKCELYYRVHLPEGMREDDILGLALSVTFEAEPGDRSDRLFMSSLFHPQRWRENYFNKWESAHTWFTYHPLQPRHDGRDWSNLTINFNHSRVMLKKCGAHVVCKQEQDDQRVVFRETENPEFAYDGEFVDDPEFGDRFVSVKIGKKSRENYGVFLSFRGVDVRNTFISRLYEKLRDKGIHTFKGSEQLERGDRRRELFDAIEGSRIAVVTFSENYARSKWCLNELTKIMARKKLGNIVVLPICYKVSLGEVRLHEKEDGVKGCYQLAMEEMVALHGTEMANLWHKALREGGDLIDESVQEGEDEGPVVQRVVEKVLKILDPLPLEVAKHPPGIDYRLKDIKPLLHIDPHVDDVYMIGIHGLGGVGKTTLAKAIRNCIADKFDGRCFLRDVRTKDLVLSQKTLLRQLLREPRLKVGRVDEGKHLIKERLCRKRVLVILDDVDSSDQLKALAGGLDWFGKGSRVIITTRDRHVLDSVPVQHVHEITSLDKDEAESLFRRHAFKSGQEDKKIDNLLIDSCLNYAAGHPLALVVLGSFLCGREEPEWKSTLEKLGKNPDKTMNYILKISFEGLEDEQKETFLDIACFFNHCDRDYVTKILDSCDFETSAVMDVLVKRCLVTVEDDTFHMDDLLEAMGKSIICDEKATRGFPSRIWSYKDFLNVLSDDVVPENDVVKGIVLNLDTEEKMLVNANSFEFSSRLRLLIVRNPFDPEERLNCQPKEPLNFPPELRWLEWRYYSASTVSFSASSKLVGLDMWWSNIKEISGEEFTELKYVNLSRCESLTTLPNLSKSSKLEDLNLSFCENLTVLDEAIGSLDKLVHLNLQECRSLSTFPSSLKSRHFRTLDWGLAKFPAIEEELHFLTELNLDGTALKELPDSISNLVAVKILDMELNYKLSIFPASIGRLENLEELRLRYCSSLEEVQGLPPHLVKLDMEGCGRLRTFPRLHTFMSQSPRIFVNLSGCANLGSAYMNESLPYQKVREFQGVAEVTLPADEIPDWMNFKTAECELGYRVPLPEGMLEDDILGLALSVTFEFDTGSWSGDTFLAVDCSVCRKTMTPTYQYDVTDPAQTWFTYYARQRHTDNDEEYLGRFANWSNITFRFNGGTGIRLKECGAHVVCKKEQDDQRFVVHKTEDGSDSEFGFNAAFDKVRKRRKRNDGS